MYWTQPDACGGPTGRAIDDAGARFAARNAVASTQRHLLPSIDATPSPSDLPLQSADFTCRLPVLLASAGGDYAAFNGGFVTFPSGVFHSDPTGGIHSRYLEQDFATDATPTLYGRPQAGSPFYDLAKGRWIPVAPAQSTPDGAFYAYATGSPSVPMRIHVVDVARGTEKLIPIGAAVVGTPPALQVADFDSKGVYLLASQVEQYPSGVWLVDPASGAIRALAQIGGVMMVRGGYAWIGRADPRDPSPPRFPASGGLYDSITRVDLSTGAEITWIYAPGRAVRLTGLDSGGRPIVSISSGPDYPIDTSEIRLIRAPNGAGDLVRAGGVWLSDPQVDRDRLWFGNDRGLYVYTQARGLRKVFAFGGTASLAQQIIPAGYCR